MLTIKSFRERHSHTSDKIIEKKKSSHFEDAQYLTNVMKRGRCRGNENATNNQQHGLMSVLNSM
jgi:hypothetical protein